MKNEELLSNTISYLRFPLTVGVVFIHYNLTKINFTIHGIQYGLNYPEWFYFIVNLFSEVLPRIAVPLFFFISGYLFFYNKEFNINIYRQKLRSRASTLLVPYFLWNVIAILIQWSHKMPVLNNFFPNACKMDVQFSLARIFNTFFANYTNEGIFVIPATDPLQEISGSPMPIDFALWYVRDLMVMVLLSPIIFLIIKRCGWWFVMSSGIFWFLFEALFMPDGGWSVMLSQALFFFSGGAYFSINCINFVDWMKKFKYAPIIYVPVALADTMLNNNNYNIYINEIGILLGMVSVVALVSSLLDNGKIKVNGTLANSSFFVFALHSLIMSDIGKVLFRILHLPDNAYSMLFIYFLVPVITIILCVALYILLKRHIPIFLNILTGGR